MAARVFVVARTVALQMLAPQRRRVQPKARRDLVQHRARNADVGDLERAAAPQSLDANSGRAWRERRSPCARRCGARPMISPLSPCRPLGTSTATTVSASALIRSMSSRGDAFDRPRRGRRRTARRSPAAGRRAGRARARSTAPVHSPAAQAASPFSAPALAEQAELHRPARACRWRAATKPSPPLLPGPHSTSDRLRADGASMTASATARPAASISVAARRAARDRGGVGSRPFPRRSGGRGRRWG